VRYTNQPKHIKPFLLIMLFLKTFIEIILKNR
jgi:hypothetical protein